ncbi:isopentenyl diphosphate delta-isomerase I [Tanacetum coccineum]
MSYSSSHPLYRESELIEENDLGVRNDAQRKLLGEVVDYLLFIDEVAKVKYVNREQLKELVMKAVLGEEGLKLSPWFRIVVDNFLFKWWDHVENGSLLEAYDMKIIRNL